MGEIVDKNRKPIAFRNLQKIKVLIFRKIIYNTRIPYLAGGWLRINVRLRGATTPLFHVKNIYSIKKRYLQVPLFLVKPEILLSGTLPRLSKWIALAELS